MMWEEATVLIPAVFGCLTFVLTQIRELLSKVVAIIDEWHDVRRALRTLSSETDREQTESTEKMEPDGA